MSYGGDEKIQSRGGFRCRWIALTKCDGAILDAFHQFVVTIELDVNRHVRGICLKHSIELLGDCGIAKTKIARMQQQQPARLQAAGKIRHQTFEILETQKRVAALSAEGGEIAMNQYRQTENRVVTFRRFTLCRGGHGEGHAHRVSPRSLAAKGNIARIDIDAFDDRGRKITAQGKSLLAPGAPERQEAQTLPVTQALRREQKQPRITIRQRIGIGLEAAGNRSTKSSAQRVTGFAYSVYQPVYARKIHRSPTGWKIQPDSSNIKRNISQRNTGPQMAIAMTDLDIPLRGARDYVQSSDLFTALEKLARAHFSVHAYLQKLVLRKLASHQIEASFSPHETAFGTFEIRNEQTVTAGWLVETNRRIERRNLYDEAPVANAAVVRPGRVFLSAPVQGYTAFDQAVILLKILGAQLNAGRCLVAKLDLTKPFQSISLWN